MMMVAAFLLTSPAFPDGMGIPQRYTADAGGLPEGVDRTALLSDGTVQGVNSWGDTGWGGPNPPSGTHRYVFTLYALDVPLELGSGSTAGDLRGAVRGHVLGTATLTGTYSRSR